MAGNEAAYKAIMAQACAETEHRVTEDIPDMSNVTFDVAGATIVPGVMYAFPTNFAKTTPYLLEDKRRSDPYNLYGSKLSKDNSLPIIRPATLTEDFRVHSCAGILSDLTHELPDLSITNQAAEFTTHPNMRIWMSREKPNPETFVTEFKRREWYTMQDKVGPIASRMLQAEDLLLTKDEYNELEETRKAVIIVDLLLTSVNDNREEFFWIGLPTCPEQLLATIQAQIARTKNWEAPPLSPTAAAIATISVINGKAQKIADIFIEKREVPQVLSAALVRQFDGEKRRIQETSSIDWKKLLKLADTPMLIHRIEQAKIDIEEHKQKQVKTTEQPSMFIEARKPGGLTLTKIEREELEKLTMNGGTKMIPIEKAVLLLNAVGEEVAGITTAYSDLAGLNAALSVKEHIKAIISPMCMEESLLRVPPLTALKIVSLRLDGSNWSLAHFGNVLYTDTNTDSAAMDMIEVLSGKMHLKKAPKHGWHGLTSMAAFVFAVRGLREIVESLLHPSIWDANAIEQLLRKIEALYRTNSGQIDLSMLERFFKTRVREHCAIMRGAILNAEPRHSRFDEPSGDSKVQWDLLVTATR